MQSFNALDAPAGSVGWSIVYIPGNELALKTLSRRHAAHLVCGNADPGDHTLATIELVVSSADVLPWT